MNEVDHLGWDQIFRSAGASEQMLLKDSCGLGQAMGQQSCGIQALKGHGPTVLPVQGETRKNGKGCKHPEQTSIGDTMQSSNQRGPPCNPAGRQRALDQPQSFRRRTLFRSGDQRSCRRMCQ